MNGEKKEGKKKKKKTRIIGFCQNMSFWQNKKNEKFKFYWKVPTINIF